MRSKNKDESGASQIRNNMRVLFPNIQFRGEVAHIQTVGRNESYDRKFNTRLCSGECRRDSLDSTPKDSSPRIRSSLAHSVLV